MRIGLLLGNDELGLPPIGERDRDECPSQPAIGGRHLPSIGLGNPVLLPQLLRCQGVGADLTSTGRKDTREKHRGADDRRESMSRESVHMACSLAVCRRATCITCAPSAGHRSCAISASYAFSPSRATAPACASRWPLPYTRMGVRSSNPPANNDT